MSRRRGPWLEVAGLLAGAAVSATGINLFLVPNRLIDGGLTGLAILLYDLFRLPVGPTLLVLNVPLFLLATRVLGRPFGLRTLVGTAALSAALTVVPVHRITTDPLLAAVYGGVLSGGGLGVIFRMGGSTGGTDLIARLLRHFFALPVGVGLLGSDFAIIALFGLVMGAKVALYSLIALFVGSRVVDFVLEGLDVQRAALIISDRPAAIARAILDELGRGVTALAGTGLYSGQERQVLFTVVSRLETGRLKAIVARTDPDAFLVIHAVHEVLGEGFRRLSAGH